MFTEISIIFKDSKNAFQEYPKLLFPLMVCWCFYAPLLLYTMYYFPWDKYEISSVLFFIFLEILFLSLIFSWCTLVLLELIKMIETDNTLSLSKSILAGSKNTIIALPIALIWAVIWFVITIVEAILSKGAHDTNNFNMMSATKTLAGYEDVTLSGLFFDALKKGVRMITFLIYPAIAWERMGIISSMKKGLVIAKEHKAIFLNGFIATWIIGAIVFIPPGIIIYFSKWINFHEVVWFITILYIAIAWSYSMFVEQMFVAELYMWHLLWEKEVKEAEKNNLNLPELSDIRKPRIMDNIPDLYIAGVS